ncbi:MAG: hypothetical protein U1F25_02425 [Rubrivivax sp.]
MASVYGLVGGVERSSYVASKHALVGLDEGGGAGDGDERHHLQRRVPWRRGDAHLLPQRQADGRARRHHARRSAAATPRPTCLRATSSRRNRWPLPWCVVQRSGRRDAARRCRWMARG